MTPVLGSKTQSTGRQSLYALRIDFFYKFAFYIFYDDASHSPMKIVKSPSHANEP